MPVPLSRIINEPGYTTFSIAKKKGGTRNISAPSPHLKKIQRTINYYLQAIYLIYKPDCSFGFIIKPADYSQWHTIVSNASRHTNKKFVMNIDLQDFFPSITAKRVKELFQGSIFQFSEEISNILALLCTYQKSLPTGSPASPVISNFICLEMDGELIAFCKEKNITYSRYADDLTFSSDNYFTKEYVSEIKTIIQKHNFTINPKKFRIQSSFRQQTVTGLLVNRRVNVDRKYIRNLRAVLHHWHFKGLDEAIAKHHNWFKDQICDDDRHKFIRMIHGKINFVRMVRGKGDPIYTALYTKFERFFSSPDQMNIFSSY
jgi:RNA-directed DNA polymerase